MRRGSTKISYFVWQTVPSLAEAHPEIAAQWDYEANGSLLPQHVTYGSNKRVAWLCRECACGHAHKWEADINDRTIRNRGCPVCAHKRPCQCNSLAALHQDLAAQWHPTANGPHQPADFTEQSHFKATWQCSRHSPSHVWEAAIMHRTKQLATGCPKCFEARRGQSSRRVSVAAERPDLAQQWHPTKNGALTPADVTCGSVRQVWWLCEKSTCQHPHEWPVSVNSRVSLKTGRHFCSKRRFCVCNSLAGLVPEVAKEWHPTHNGDFMLEQCAPAAGKCVWWQHVTPKGDVHEWAGYSLRPHCHWLQVPDLFGTQAQAA